MGRLEGRSVLVTGATSGIGRAIARRCAGEGARVLATGRDENRLAELREEYPSIAVYAADLTAGDAADACAALAVSARSWGWSCVACRTPRVRKEAVPQRACRQD